MVQNFFNVLDFLDKKLGDSGCIVKIDVTFSNYRRNSCRRFFSSEKPMHWQLQKCAVSRVFATILPNKHQITFGSI
jgi:hypothetical protein